MPTEPKVVLVTGGARNLGREYAEFFAADGAKVVVADINEEGAEKVAAAIVEAGGDATAVGVDVSDEASTLAMADRAVAAYGHIDVLINNAALYGDYNFSQSFLDMPVRDFETFLAVNIKGVFLCTRAAIRSMQAQRWGRVINISSVGALLPGPYGVTKMAVNQMTWGLSHFAGEGVTINCIAPGPIFNESTNELIGDDVKEGLMRQLVVKRPGTARDMYGMMKYLISDDAEWVTGQTYMVNGGSHVSF